MYPAYYVKKNTEKKCKKFNGLFLVKEEGKNGFSEGWQGCLEEFFCIACLEGMESVDKSILVGFTTLSLSSML